jgi:predicted AAA+ superfamily ATPase
LYFWRDSSGNEMDVVIDNAGTLHPVEIKSGKTITPEFFKNFKFWQKISGTEGGAVIYGGEQVQNRSNGLKIVPWNSLEARI